MISEVAHSTGDVGAIYSGRDMTMRGNKITNNKIKKITNSQGSGTVGVYLDDLFSGTIVSGNYIDDVDKCILIGGGSDNIVSHNRLSNCTVPVWVDARGIYENKNKILLSQKGSSWDLRTKLNKVKNNIEYLVQYPEIIKTLESSTFEPRGNRVSNNQYDCEKKIVKSNRKLIKSWYKISGNKCIKN
jgi:parallel beta-helix repeat protein